MNHLRPLLLFLTFLLSLLIGLSLIPGDHWIVQTWEYLLFQLMVLLTLCLLTWLLVIRRWRWHHWAVFAFGLAAVGYGLSKISPFFPFAKKELLTAERRDSVNDLSLIIANVYQHNDRYDQLAALVHRHEPDLLLAMETDQAWVKGLEELHPAYPHRVLAPLDNTYGMALYSRLPLHDAAVHYFVEDSVFAIETMVELPSGRLVKLYGVHPRPPAPGENPTSIEKDQELVIIGRRVKRLEVSYRPVIVAGDLNDVAWSPTTRLFRQLSGLLDARRGRGFFNTFPVAVPVFRFPLDHLFCSDHFKLVAIKRLPDIGSDHFPLYVHLQSHQPFREDQDEPHADSTDLEQAKEIMDKKAPGRGG